MNLPTCALCGAISLDVRPGIAEYPDSDASSVRYKALMRCSDHDACQERVRAAGEDWPLVVREEATA